MSFISYFQNVLNTWNEDIHTYVLKNVYIRVEPNGGRIKKILFTFYEPSNMMIHETDAN